MALFDNGPSLGTQVSVATNAVSALGSLSQGAAAFKTAARAANIASFVNGAADVLSAAAMFGNMVNPNDWRVSLSIPNWISFIQSPVLKPLKDAGAMVFPYTPEVALSSNAKYTPIATTHNNYPFQAYESSNPGTITITAPFYVEDQDQALYWIAALHYFRSVTKMFSGTDIKAGNPPPIVFLNGYGSYVFRNVPVAITSFQTTLPKDCDYISCNTVGSALGAVAGAFEAGEDVLNAFGLSAPGLGGLGSLAATVGSLGVGGSTSAGTAYVPTKSSFQVTLQPMYARTTVRKFSLERFVTGGYVNSPYGYV